MTSDIHCSELTRRARDARSRTGSEQPVLLVAVCTGTRCAALRRIDSANRARHRPTRPGAATTGPVPLESEQTSESEQSLRAAIRAPRSGPGLGPLSGSLQPRQRHGRRPRDCRAISAGLAGPPDTDRPVREPCSGRCSRPVDRQQRTRPGHPPGLAAHRPSARRNPVTVRSRHRPAPGNPVDAASSATASRPPGQRFRPAPMIRRPRVARLA